MQTCYRENENLIYYDSNKVLKTVVFQQLNEIKAFLFIVIYLLLIGYIAQILALFWESVTKTQNVLSFRLMLKVSSWSQKTNQNKNSTIVIY